MNSISGLDKKRNAAHLIVCIALILKYMEQSAICNWKKSIFDHLTLVKVWFGHQTPKPVIFDHPTTKTAQIWPLGCFDRWF
jgi:hypothetical protein